MLVSQRESAAPMMCHSVKPSVEERGAEKKKITNKINWTTQTDFYSPNRSDHHMPPLTFGLRAVTSAALTITPWFGGEVK